MTEQELQGYEGRSAVIPSDTSALTDEIRRLQSVGSNEDKYHQALVQCQSIINTALGSTEPPVPVPIPPPVPFMVFLPDHPINTRCDTMTVDPNSANLIASLGLTTALHPTFGAMYQGQLQGIPFNWVDASTPRHTVTFQWPAESDPGPYPIPANPLIEAGSDAHIICIDRAAGKLYELFAAQRSGSGAWSAGSGAIFDMTTNHHRPPGWTSADASGMAIYPILAQYDEIATGQILHSLRFTAVNTRRGYVHPARHFASAKTDVNLLPMGARLRLKASVDISGFPPPVKVILTALKQFGMLLADNGQNGFLSGAPDDRFDDAVLGRLKEIKMAQFECCLLGPVTTVGA